MSIIQWLFIEQFVKQIGRYLGTLKCLMLGEHENKNVTGKFNLSQNKMWNQITGKPFLLKNKDKFNILWAFNNKNVKSQYRISRILEDRLLTKEIKFLMHYF